MTVLCIANREEFHWPVPFQPLHVRIKNVDNGTGNLRVRHDLIVIHLVYPNIPQLLLAAAAGRIISFSDSSLPVAIPVCASRSAHPLLLHRQILDSDCIINWC